jgi:hypothetical protein
VYADRNSRFAHSHEEATVADALRARASWIELRDMMQTLFSKSQGVSLASIQALLLGAQSADN